MNCINVFAIQMCWIVKKIEESEQYANDYRFTALFPMIGYGSTGLYPNLSTHWEELQQDINNYVSILSKEK